MTACGAAGFIEICREGRMSRPVSSRVQSIETLSLPHLDFLLCWEVTRHQSQATHNNSGLEAECTYTPDAGPLNAVSVTYVSGQSIDLPSCPEGDISHHSVEIETHRKKAWLANHCRSPPRFLDMDHKVFLCLRCCSQ